MLPEKVKQHAFLSARRANGYSYFVIPKSLLCFGKTIGISSDAALLYVVLADRAKLSMSNGWIDEHGCYLYFKRTEAADYLGWSLRKTVSVFQTLVRVGLLEERETVYPNGKRAGKRLYLRAWTLPTASFRLDDIRAGRFPKLEEQHLCPEAAGDYFVLPKMLLEDERYRGLSLNAILLYMLVLDRLYLSMRYERVDENGLLWTTMDQEKAMEQIGCKGRTLTSAYSELEEIGLIYRVKPKFSGKWRVYARDYMPPAEPEEAARDPEPTPAAWEVGSGTKENPSDAVVETHTRNNCTSDSQNLHPIAADFAPPYSQKMHVINHTLKNHIMKKPLEEKASPPLFAQGTGDVGMLSPRKEMLRYQEGYNGEAVEWTHYDEAVTLLYGHLSPGEADRAVFWLDLCCDVIEKDLRGNLPYFAIGNTSVPREELLSAYQKLDAVTIFILAQKFAEYDGSIREPERYLRAVLFRANQQYAGFVSHLRNEWECLRNDRSIGKGYAGSHSCKTNARAAGAKTDLFRNPLFR